MAVLRMEPAGQDIMFSDGVFKRKCKISYQTESATRTGEKLATIVTCNIDIRRKLYCVNGVGVVILILAALAVAFVMSSIAAPSKKREPPDPEEPLPPSSSKYHIYRNGAVCSDGVPCSQIGRDILAQNGSAVDAALATLFCNGLVNSQSMGIGGGFLMTLYDGPTKQGHALIARESAPMAVTEGMYQRDPSSTRVGARAVGVPGELRGYWTAHQRFGRLPWASLLEPTIKLCEDGYPMSKHQRDSLGYRETLVKDDPVLRSVFVDEKTGDFYKMGTIIRFKQLCQTFRVIAEEGGDSLYNGTLADKLLEDLHEAGGIITREDLNNYRALWVPPITTELSGKLTILGVPPPGSGVLLGFILKILDGFHFNPSVLTSTESVVLAYHRTIEAFKYAFAVRGEIGDPFFNDDSQLMKNITSSSFVEEIRERIDSRKPSSNPADYGAKVHSTADHGTAHVSVLHADGSAVSVTSSVNLYYGAGITSPQTGIILNSGMDDFSFPFFSNYFGLGWSPANSIAPGKRSLSSMCPTIVLDNGRVRLSIGASGGTKITTAVAFVLMRHLWFGEDLKAAVDASRIHHQLLPPEISYEYGMLKSVKEGLEAMGHNLTRYKDRGSVVCALAWIGDAIFGNADFRKGGEVYGV